MQTSLQRDGRVSTKTRTSRLKKNKNFKRRSEELRVLTETSTSTTNNPRSASIARPFLL